MAQLPSPIKLFQIEEPDGSHEAEEGIGLAVGIELSETRGASVAASVGGNAELVVQLDGSGLRGGLSESDLRNLLLDLRSLTEKALAQPVTHAVIRLDGVMIQEEVLLRAAAGADIALLGIRRDGTALEAAIEAEDLAVTLMR
jgi:hypothetical protein